MKIWVIGRGIPSKKNRMLGSFELGQAKMLSDENDVTYIAQIFSYTAKKGTPGYFYNSYMDEGVRVCCRTVPYFPARLNIHLKKYIHKVWEMFLKKIEVESGLPDVIHIHYPTMITDPDVIGKYKSRGIKIVCTEHWTKVLTGQLDNYEKRQLCKYVEISNSFICVGQPLKEAVCKLSDKRKKICVIPNVVSDLFYANKKIKLKDELKFVAIGRMVPVKQFDRIVEAFNAVVSDYNVCLEIIGDGPEYKKVQDKILQYGITNQVVLTGTMSREEVAEEIRNSDCLICFSKLETFGVPIIEGWACGLPVISSDCLGFSEFWNDDVGIIVPHEDVKKLSEAMTEIVENYGFYNKELISKFAQDNFGKTSIYDKLMKVYRNEN